MPRLGMPRAAMLQGQPEEQATMEATELQNRFGMGRREPLPPPERGERGARAQGAGMNVMASVRNPDPQRMAQGLGWFSIGLGLAELLMPYAVARLCGGSGRHTGLIRLYGIRELAAGVAILTSPKQPVTGMWSRVAGDAIDIATLGLAAVSPRTNKAGVAFALANVAAVTALDVHCAQELSKQTGAMTEEGFIVLKRSITVNRSPEELYGFWKNLENLPQFMYHLQSVRNVGEGRSHWVTKGPAGTTVEWDAQITEDRPNELLAWRSLEGADVDQSGVVRFERQPGGRGTAVRVEMQYRPPAGIAGTAVAAMFNQAPEQQIYDDLRRFKQIMEIGEIVRSDALPEGAGQMLQRPARPLQSAPAAEQPRPVTQSQQQAAEQR
jgi:uncharacterized membrane protein